MLPRSSKTPRTVRSLKSSRCEDPTALKAVLFDLDGTLIDTLDMIRASLRFATETVLGRAIPDDELMHNVGIPLIKQMGEFDADRAGLAKPFQLRRHARSSPRPGTTAGRHATRLRPAGRMANAV